MKSLSTLLVALLIAPATFASGISPEVALSGQMMASDILQKKILVDSRIRRILTGVVKNSTEDGVSAHIDSVICEPAAGSIFCEVTVLGKDLEDTTGENDISLTLLVSLFQGQVYAAKDITLAM